MYTVCSRVQGHWKTFLWRLRVLLHNVCSRVYGHFYIFMWCLSMYNACSRV